MEQGVFTDENKTLLCQSDRRTMCEIITGLEHAVKTNPIGEGNELGRQLRVTVDGNELGKQLLDECLEAAGDYLSHYLSDEVGNEWQTDTAMDTLRLRKRTLAALSKI